jgi:hypothetical protein
MQCNRYVHQSSLAATVRRRCTVAVVAFNAVMTLLFWMLQDLKSVSTHRSVAHIALHRFRLRH